MKRRHVVHVLTVADSLIFINTLVEKAQERGFEVTVVTSPDQRLGDFGRRLGVRVVPLEMPRRVTPLGDWVALNALHRLFERLRPDIVHSHTPKGGLLGTLAAHAAQVPVRIYHMRGLAFVTQRGAMRALLKSTELLSCSAATRVICQSHSLRSAALEDRLVSAEKSEVVLQGSNGVDSDQRFDPARFPGRREALRAEWKVPPKGVVFAFVGRLVRDKGLPELVEAFERLARTSAGAVLVLAGPWEARDPVPAETRRRIDSHPRIMVLGPVAEPAAIYAASDVVVLPSHREGFPNVPLEAAAMERPVVSTRVAGCSDAVADGQTGLLVEVADVPALEGAMRRYLEDTALRQKHGLAGRQRVVRDFRRENVANALVDVYLRELSRI